MTSNLAPGWFDKKLREEPGPGRFWYTTNRYPIFYLQITKCGCTFIKNLFYYLDHDQTHPESTRIHAHQDDLVKADLIPRRFMDSSPYIFTVVRDPIDRFLSLYYDKFADLDNKHDKGMRRRVSRAADLKIKRKMTLEDHQEACLKSLKWIGRNLDTKEEGKPNPHWQRQSQRLRQAERLNARYLTLDGLRWQLPALLSPVIPDIAEKMKAVGRRNVSPKPFSRDQIMTPELKEAVRSVYEQDTETYARVRAEWGPEPERIS